MHDAHAERYVTRPGALLLMVWGVVLFLSFYGADVVRDEVEKNEMLAEQTWLVDGLTAMMKASDAIGLSALKEGLGGARETINAKYAILEKPAPVAPPPPPVEVVVAPETTPEPGAEAGPKHVAPRRPKRVLVIGASSIQFAIGGELEARLPEYEGVTVKRFGKLATGLSRPDFFDWPKEFRKLASSFRPDLVIANFGGNGAQSIPTGKYDKAKWGKPEWDAAYAAKVKEMVAIADGVNAKMVFFGMPVMRSAKFTKKMTYLNQVQAEAAREAGAMFVSTAAMSAMPNGKYRKTIKVGKKRGLMRTSDGVHYTKLGAKYVVGQAMQEVERAFAMVPGDPALAVAEGHAFVSKALDREVEYVAYVPREAGGEVRRRAVLLFPDPEADWSAWPNWPHRKLQRVAQAEGAVLVVVKTPPEGWWVGEGLDAVTDELLVDVQAHLPVTEELSVAGAGAGATAALGLALRAPKVVRGVSLYGGPLDLPPFDAAKHAGLRYQLWPGGAGYDRLEAALKAAEVAVELRDAKGPWADHLEAVVARTTAPAPETN